MHVNAALLGELERSCLAEIIHDDVLQVLGAGLVAAETCEQAWQLRREELLPGYLDTLRRVLEQGIGRLRHLMVDLRPYRRQSGGLDGALQGVFGAFLDRNRGKIAYDERLDQPMSNLAELLTYRLVVETLRAVQDPDEPVDIRFSLRVQDTGLELEAVCRPCDGRTIKRALLAPNRIALIRWQVQAIGGSLTGEPAQPDGILIRIHLPVP